MPPADILGAHIAVGHERYLVTYPDTPECRLSAYKAICDWQQNPELSFGCKELRLMAQMIAPQDAGACGRRREGTAPPAFIKRLVVVTWAAACGVVIYLAGRASGKL